MRFLKLKELQPCSRRALKSADIYVDSHPEKKWSRYVNPIRDYNNLKLPLFLR